MIAADRRRWCPSLKGTEKAQNEPKPRDGQPPDQQPLAASLTDQMPTSLSGAKPKESAMSAETSADHRRRARDCDGADKADRAAQAARPTRWGV